MGTNLTIKVEADEERGMAIDIHGEWSEEPEAVGLLAAYIAQELGAEPKDLISAAALLASGLMEAITDEYHGTRTDMRIDEDALLEMIKRSGRKGAEGDKNGENE